MSGDSESNGALERIVENWLTSASERSYQISFCQLLSAEGESPVYIAAHGWFEKGKDVISLTSSGEMRAYQLKGGDIKLADWRAIQGQIVDLVELPFTHPSLPNTKHDSYLVTNGRVDDSVIDHINAANVGWRNRGLGPLTVISRGQLVSRFLSVHGSYLPKEAKDFQAFLNLLLRDPRSPLDKDAFSTFIESVLPLFVRDATKKDTSRALSSVLLLVTYILESSVESQNHWALFEGFTIACSYILGAATKFQLDRASWKVSFDLALANAETALGALADECFGKNEFIEGNPLTDGYFYRARQLMLAGLCSTRLLSGKRQGQTSQPEHVRFVCNAMREGFIWGESAVGYVFSIALFLESQCKQPLAEQLIIETVQLLALCNGEKGRGMPDPYTSIEDSILWMHGLDDLDKESYRGFSYTIPLYINYLARRLRRRALQVLWPQLTRISFLESSPQEDWEWYRWRSDSALVNRFAADEPQSWAKLRDLAKLQVAEFPTERLSSNDDFLLYFCVVFPHRLTRSTSRLLEAKYQI